MKIFKIGLVLRRVQLLLKMLCDIFLNFLSKRNEI